LEENGHIVAALACPTDPPQVAWFRIFGYTPSIPAQEAWSALWETARAETFNSNIKIQFATIIVKQWFQSLILSSGFTLKQNIVLLQLTNNDSKSFSIPKGIRIRTMKAEDIPAVVGIDLAAFGWFWHNTTDSLERARMQALSATVAEDDSGVIAYQLSTGNTSGAHLARLGVRPEAQGRGIGTALVSNLIQQLGTNQLNRLSVNTQSDNAASLKLYKKLGFVLTGEYFPVYVYPANIGLND
jgi:ribosomal protein S18 acetylase RimI-like enzyme